MDYDLLTRETSRRVVSAPALKGRRIPAQGGTLGMRGDMIRRSAKVQQERRNGWDWADALDSRICGVPSERRGMPWTAPRALPWAGMRCPVGTPGADPVLPITATPAPTSSSPVRSFRVPVPDFAKALQGRSPSRSWHSFIAHAGWEAPRQSGLDRLVGSGHRGIRGRD